MRLGTTAIAGLHVPGTQVFCIEKDQDMFDSAEARVKKFMEANKFILPEAYAIFAKVKIIPGNGASTAESELSKVLLEDETTERHSSDGASEGDEGVTEFDEAVDPLVLLKFRLRLRPTHLSCIAGGFVDAQHCAIIEAASLGSIGIHQSRIENGGLGVFAILNIEKGEELLPYWGEIYVTTAQDVGRLVLQLSTERMVQTKKYITGGGIKQL